MPGISRDRDRAARQLAGLARTNSVLAARLQAGELPGYKGPLEGTEHLHEGEPARPEPAMPGSPVEPGSSPATPGTAPVPGSEPGMSPAEPGTRVRVGTYDTPGDHGPTDPHEPEPEPSAGPDAPADPPAQRRGVLGQLVDGFTGRV